MKTKTTKVILKPLVMAKVDYMCQARPANEWSGNIFFRVTEDSPGKEDSPVSITVEDLALMDHLGSSGFTSFSNNDDYALNYISRHRSLLGCIMGLLHSHHSMYSCGPSGTDDDTMKKEGNAPDVSNFLSIIVYNDRKQSNGYSVRITQRTKTKVFSGAKFANEFQRWKYQGVGSTVFKDFEELEILDIPQENITYSEPSWTEKQKNEFLERIKSLEDARKKEEEESRNVVKHNGNITGNNYRHGMSVYSYEDWYSDFSDYDFYARTGNDSYDYKQGITSMQIAKMIASLSFSFNPNEFLVMYDIKIALIGTNKNMKALGFEQNVEYVEGVVELILDSLQNILFPENMVDIFRERLGEAIEIIEKVASSTIMSVFVKAIIKEAKRFNEMLRYE